MTFDRFTRAVAVEAFFDALLYRAKDRENFETWSRLDYYASGLHIGEIYMKLGITMPRDRSFLPKEAA